MQTETAKNIVRTALARYVNAARAGEDIDLWDIECTINNLITSLALMDFSIYTEEGELVQEVELLEDEIGRLWVIPIG